MDRNRTALVETEEHLRQVERELAALPGESTIAQAQDQLFALTRQLSDIADHRAAAAERDPPRYLLRSLGAPPDDAHGRSLWREAARPVESYRGCAGTSPILLAPSATNPAIQLNRLSTAGPPPHSTGTAAS